MTAWSRIRSSPTVHVVGLYVTACAAGLQLLDVLATRLDLPDRFFLQALIISAFGLPVVAAAAMLREAALQSLSLASQDTAAGGREKHWVTPPRPPRRRRAFAAATLILVLTLLVSLAFVGGGSWLPLRSVEATPLPEQPGRLLIAGIRSPTQDTLLAAAAAEVIRLDLERIPDLLLIPGTGIWEPLLRTESRNSSSQEAALARDIALREGVSVALSGELARFGGAFIISARLTHLNDGTSLLSLRKTAADSAAIVTALDEISAELRSQLLGPLRPAVFARSAEPVSTASPTALQRYADAAHALRIRRDTASSVVMLEQAVQLDPGFARAWRDLGLARYCSGADPVGVEHALTAAYQRRNRFSEREWYSVVAAYQLIIRNDAPRAETAYRMLLDLDPQDRTARRFFELKNQPAVPDQMNWTSLFCSA